jgi:hypothetical protein
MVQHRQADLTPKIFYCNNFLKAGCIAMTAKAASGATYHASVLGVGASSAASPSHCGESCKVDTDESFFHRDFQLK